jgi:hypothetical protein
MSRRSIPGLLLSLFISVAAAAAPTKITELSARDMQRLNQGRMLVLRYLPDEDTRKQYLTPAGKLGTLRAILGLETQVAGKKDLLEALGVVLGDTFVQDMGFHWVAVENESGRQLAVRLGRRSILLYPLDMISQRIQRGERIDIVDLYNDLAADVEEMMEDERK